MPKASPWRRAWEQASPRSLDSSGSSAHWINPTHQATPTGESPESRLFPSLFSQLPLPVPTPWPEAPALRQGYPFPESPAPTRGDRGSALSPLSPSSPWDTCIQDLSQIPSREAPFSPRLLWDGGKGSLQ